MPTRLAIGERPRIAAMPEKFRSPQEEIDYLRQRVREQEQALELPNNSCERDRLAHREVTEYAQTPTATILHETIVMPEHDIIHEVLKLEP